MKVQDMLSTGVGVLLVWKVVRFQIRLLLWFILRVVRHNIGRGPYLCSSQVMLMTTYKFLRWMHSTIWMHERVVLSAWYRGEDAGDLTRSELNELVENLTCLNALVGVEGRGVGGQHRIEL